MAIHAIVVKSQWTDYALLLDGD